MLHAIRRVTGFWPFKALVVVVWLVTMVVSISNGWVSRSWETINGGVVFRQNYFDLRQTTLFVWLTLLIVGYAAYWLRRRALGWYGVLEVLVGSGGGIIAVTKVPLTTPGGWFALFASAFVLVRGATNIHDDHGGDVKPSRLIVVEAEPGDPVVVAASALQDERKHLEGLLKDRISFHLVFSSLFLVGVDRLSSPGLRLVGLLAGTIVSALLSLAVLRTYVLVQEGLKLTRSNPQHPYTVLCSRARRFPVNANHLVIGVPFILTLFFAILFCSRLVQFGTALWSPDDVGGAARDAGSSAEQGISSPGLRRGQRPEC